MPLAVDPHVNPLARLYDLSAVDGARRQESPHDLFVSGLMLDRLGGDLPSSLLQFLKTAAGRALTLCQLRRGKEVLADYAEEPFTSWFRWDAVEGLVGMQQACEKCLGEILDLREPLMEYEANAGTSGEGLTDGLLSVPDMLQGCGECGGRFSLDIRLEKEPLVKKYLLDAPATSGGGALGLVWFDRPSMEAAFGSFREFLSVVGERAGRPLVFFFHQPLAPFEGYYFKALSLKTLASPAALAASLGELTPSVLDDYRVFYKNHEHESRPDRAVSERFNIPPSLFLRQKGELAHYPLHELFIGGPLRSLLLYAVLSWLAEKTVHEEGITSFTLRSKEDGPFDIHVAFTMTDACVGGESVFGGDWGGPLASLAREIGLSAGSEQLREHWGRALSEQTAARFTAPLLFATLEAALRRFEDLKKQPFEIEGPDVQLMILAEQWHREEKTETQAGEHKETKVVTSEETKIKFYLTPINQGLGLPAGPVGAVSMERNDEYVPHGELSEMAARHLKAVLTDDPQRINPPVPDVEKLKNRGRKLWKRAIPSEFKDVYRTLRHQNELSFFIVSDSHSFPWELIVPFEQKGSDIFPEGIEDPWLALKFVIGRWTVGLKPPANAIGMSRVCCVAAGQDLASTKREVCYFESLRPEVIIDLPRSKEELLDWLGTRDYDVIHFACHGQFNTGNPGESAILLPDRSLMYPDELYSGDGGKNISNSISRNRPLVFLNACHTGRTGTTLLGVEGWADSLIRHGCGAFIGCGWEVADPLAAEFAVSFYEEFRRSKPLGHAIHEARRRIMQGNEGNSTWLAYYLYGNPECILRRPQ